MDGTREATNRKRTELFEDFFFEAPFDCTNTRTKQRLALHHPCRRIKFSIMSPYSVFWYTQSSSNSPTPVSIKSGMIKYFRSVEPQGRSFMRQLAYAVPGSLRGDSQHALSFSPGQQTVKLHTVQTRPSRRNTQYHTPRQSTWFAQRRFLRCALILCPGQ